MANEKVAMWRGEDIRTLSREQLLEAFRELGEDYQRLFDREMDRMKRDRLVFRQHA